MTISITRVYTRTGDGGETALVGGRRVPKDSPRIVAYGTIDELNAVVGLVRVFNAERMKTRGPRRKRHHWLDEILQQGPEPALRPRQRAGHAAGRGLRGHVPDGRGRGHRARALMDDCQKDLEPLKSFVLPGGGRVQGFLHQARTVCRRAERELLALSRVEPVGEWPLRYVNRLSDLFFVLGRWVGKHMGEKEYLWERGLSAHAPPTLTSAGASDRISA